MWKEMLEMKDGVKFTSEQLLVSCLREDFVED